MKIERLQIIDYQGLTGKREYAFPEKLVVLAAPNGKGKTSIINAIRFGITGDAQPGFMISDVASKCDIGLILDSGTQIIRELPRKGQGAPKQWLNRRPVEKKVLETAISNETGVAAGATRITTASELVGHMKPQDLGDFMLGYIPETLDGLTVTSYIPNVTKGMAEEIAAFFPEQFGVEMLDKFYAHCYERRKEIKKQRTEAAGMLKAIECGEMPQETKEELMKQLEAIHGSASAAAKYKAEMEAYQKAVSARERVTVSIQKMQKELMAIPRIEEEPKIRASKLEFAPKFREDLAKAERDLAVAKTQLETTTKAIDALSGSICPLSTTLKCTTDKSELTAQLGTMQNQQRENVKQCEDVLKKCKNVVEAFDNEVNEYRKNHKLWEDQQRLTEGIKTLTASLDSEPVKPAAPETKSLPSEESIRIKLETIQNWARKETLQKDVAAYDVRIKDYDALVNAFAPKGIVKEKVTSAYIDAFEESCNQKAEELRHGMRVKFVKGNGITPMLDVNGNGYYYPYPALSGGEKIYLIFLLLDMFNSMTGLRMMFLDELSVLDKQNFEALIRVLENHAEEYDQIFLTMVDHDPLMAVVYGHGLVPVEI